jgi:hypothetical protein
MQPQLDVREFSGDWLRVQDLQSFDIIA